MDRRRRLVTWALTLFLVLGSVAFIAPAATKATTGPTKFLPPSRYQVGSAIQRLYTGQYLFHSAAPAARLHGGAMGVEINNQGQLYGVVQFYAYDDQGRQSTWVGTLYNFHQTKNKVMIIDILAPSGSLLLGRFLVNRSNKGDLSGQITLPNGKFAISWQKLSAK